ncbi:MAG: CRISPR-associated protein Cas4 [Methanoculleaceae archaeon]
MAGRMAEDAVRFYFLPSYSDGMEKPVSVSGVVTAAVCPRRYYFGRSDDAGESPRYTVCHQIGLHLGEVLDPDEIWRECALILGDYDPEIRLFFDECISRCRSTGWPAASETGVPVSSENLGIRGRVDRIFGDDQAFAIVRPAPAPDVGVYRGDRLRIACYTACVRETFGWDVDGGFVEYIPSGVRRFVRPGPRERREMLHALKIAKRIDGGYIPPVPTGAPCEGCRYRERCRPEPRRLSDLFR